MKYPIQTGLDCLVSQVGILKREFISIPRTVLNFRRSECNSYSPTFLQILFLLIDFTLIGYPTEEVQLPAHVAPLPVLMAW